MACGVGIFVEDDHAGVRSPEHPVFSVVVGVGPVVTEEASVRIRGGGVRIDGLDILVSPGGPDIMVVSGIHIRVLAVGAIRGCSGW